MRALPILTLLLLALFSFANPLPPGWTQPKQEFATPSLQDLASALPLFAAAIALELLVSAIFLWHYKKEIGILKYVLAANCISIPAVWAYCFAAAPFFVTWHGSVGTDNFFLVSFVILSAEAFAVAFEAYFVFRLSKKQLSLGQALWMALGANAFSFLLSPAQASQELAIFPLLAALLMFPFIAAYIALPRLGLKRQDVWRAYAAQLAAYAALLLAGMACAEPMLPITIALLAELGAVILLVRGASLRKAALLALAMLGGIFVGIAALAALSIVLSTLSALAH